MNDSPEHPETQPATESRPAQAASTRSGRRPSNSRTLGQVTLGSALIAMDTLDRRLEQLQEDEATHPAGPRTLDDVLVPVAQWPEHFGVSAERPARHLMLGLMVDARSRARATTGLFNGLGRSLAGAINLFLNPLQTRPTFRPLRQGFDKAVERGQDQVTHWQTLGRAEEARSRVLAGTALASAAAETMDELAANKRVEVFIQEIVESQTAGIVDEIVEEIRERAVSSDNFFERPLRRLLRRPDRSQVPPPGFDPHLVRPIARRGLPLPEGTLLGHYAGFFSRLLALLIDVSLIVVALALLSSLLATAVDVLGLRAGFESLTGDLAGTILAAASGLLVVVGYLALFWLLTGQTLGMMLMGLRVVNQRGRRLTLGRVMLRLAGYIVLPGIFFLGFFWILGDDRRQAWHDKLAGTCVVYAWDARPDETFLTYTMHMDK